MSARARNRLIVSTRAQRDIDGILLYTTERWGAYQRRRYQQKLRGALRALKDHPERGVLREEYYPGCRRLPVEHHLVYYHLDDENIVIDRVLHGSQDASSKF